MGTNALRRSREAKLGGVRAQGCTGPWGDGTKEKGGEEEASRTGTLQLTTR